MRTCSKSQKYWIVHNFFNVDHNIGMLDLISIVLMRGIKLKKNFSNLIYPVLTTSHNYSKWWQITHFWFQFFSHHFYMAILCMERHMQMSWMYLKRSNRKLKWEHAVKLRNIGLLITSLILLITIYMLHLISIKLITGIQQKKNFSNLSYPVLTTTQNDEKLHIFDSNSLVIFSIWPYYAWRDIYRWVECIWRGVIENWNENMQYNSEILDCS